jgi:hypothetical protein
LRVLPVLGDTGDGVVIPTGSVKVFPPTCCNRVASRGCRCSVGDDEERAPERSLVMPMMSAAMTRKLRPIGVDDADVLGEGSS